MSDFGIICEFNPFHRGHQYLIEQARQKGADRIICVMSGNSTQRGTLAITDSYTRAESAVRAGADLVLELPYPWCSASAEGFAVGGISVLGNFADILIFGSECGDLSLLTRAAEVAADPSFREAYQASLSDGAPAASMYDRMLEEAIGVSLSSNDILGVEYLRAMNTLNVKMNAVTVKRQGASYSQADLRENELPSATGIRALWEADSFASSEQYLPKEVVALYRQAKENGGLLSDQALESLILGWFRLHKGEDFSEIAGASGGLAHRFCSVARDVSSLSEFYEKIRTKRYTDAHIRRVLLYCLTGVLEEDLASLPQYTTLLAANERGRALLSKRRRTNGFPVVTKPADAPAHIRQYHLTERLNSLCSLATAKKNEAAVMMKKTPYIDR